LLDRSTIDRLRSIDTAGQPVVSLYLGLEPDRDQLRSITTRLKALVNPLRERLDSSDVAEDEARILQRDLDEALAMASRIGVDLGRGAAIFLSSGAGLSEHLSLPMRVRDRAVIDVSPYLGPLEAMLDRFHRYCAIVIDRRVASVYRFHLGVLESWEEFAEEEVRKDNFGGFEGFAERRVRGHAETVARRLYRAAAARLAELWRDDAFDLLVVGGSQANVDALVGELAPDLLPRLAGTFVVDPRTTTPVEIRDRCREVAAAYDRRLDEEHVAQLLEVAGSRSRGVLGLDRAIDAANQKAIDLLLVDASEVVPGVQCTECGWLARSGDDCAACGMATRSVPDLYDAIAEQARADGGSVRYLIGDTPLSEIEIGAIVRFAVAGLRRA
jgi:peptide subunit release factor 1 (eRF1)